MEKTIKAIKKVFFILVIIAFSYQHLAISSNSIKEDYKSKQIFSKDCKKNYKVFKVIKIFDGDTILVTGKKSKLELFDSYKVRLLGIDAFEHNQNIYGKTGKDFLSTLVLNKNVCIETDVQEKDIYGRTLGYVFASDSFTNSELLKNGYAILYDFPPNIKYIDKLKKAQIHGRQNMLGIWEKNQYIKETPSQWRHKNKHKSLQAVYKAKH